MVYSKNYAYWNYKSYLLRWRQRDIVIKSLRLSVAADFSFSAKRAGLFLKTMYIYIQTLLF